MARGDHVFVSYTTYTHHGIDIGDGTIVHFSKATRSVRRTSVERFRDGRRLRRRAYRQCDPPDVTVARALRHVGRRTAVGAGYHLVFNNCEHFATWCKTGRPASQQIDAVFRTAAATSAKTLAQKGAVRIATRTATRAATRSVAHVAVEAASPWLLVADGLQLAAETCAARCGADPEEARSVGRGAGMLGSAAIGLAVAGPLGAGVSIGLWLLGEGVAACISDD